MATKSSPSIYESLASILLPEGILDLFEVTQVEEERTGKPDETGTEVRIIHIYLDERDLREQEWHDLSPNGFTESRSINDFPVRDRKVVLHVRRRRWLAKDGTSIILTHEDLTCTGKRGEKRGRPGLRSNEKFKPYVLSNGDTKVELLTRARYILPKSGDKWSENQKKRAKLLFELRPKLKEAYSLVCQLRCIFKNRKLTKAQAEGKLNEQNSEA